MTQPELRQLEIKAGSNTPKLVTVRLSREELQLCCVDRQTRGTLVQVFTRDIGDKIQMAFSFKYQDSRYSPIVDGNYLKLEEGTHSNRDSLSEHCWFEKTEADGGGHYCLRSVVNPQPFLSLSGNPNSSQRTILQLSENDDESVLFTDQ